MNLVNSKTSKEIVRQILISEEIDLVEERRGQLFGYEIKWAKSRAKAPKEWHKNYLAAEFETINFPKYSSNFSSSNSFCNSGSKSKSPHTFPA